MQASGAFNTSFPKRWRRLEPRARRVIVVVAHRYGLRAEALLSARRGEAGVAHARQLAMYLMNVIAQRTLTETGTLFGRDRATVRHACARIEDLRDDRHFDAEVEGLELRLQDEATAHG